MIAFVGHTKPVRCVAFAPDDSSLVSGADDGRVVVWDRLGGVPRHVIPTGLPGVRSVACHPDGERFCAAWRYTSLGARAAGGTEQVRFWELSSGKVAHDGEPGEARYWHRVAGIDAQEIPVEHAELVDSLAFTPDGSRLLFLDYWPRPLPLPGEPHKRWVCEYSLAPPPRERLPGGWVGRRRDVHAFALSLDGTVAAVATTDWVRAGPVAASTVPPGYPTKGAVAALALTPDGSRLAGGRGGRVTVWDAAGTGAVREFEGHAAPVEALAAHPTESLLASVGRDGAVILWEPDSGRVRGRYDFGLGAAHALAFAPDGLTLAVAGDGGLVCFDLA